MMPTRLACAMLAIAVLATPAAALAADETVVKPLNGMKVFPTSKPYATLLEDLRTAVADNKMGLVTQAGPTELAKSRGETIPGNMVVGVFRNDFAVSIIRAVPAAMIEPPIRFMVMEEPDGTGTLSYIAPSERFAPYADEGGAVLAEASLQLDAIFEQIAADAIQ